MMKLAKVARPVMLALAVCLMLTGVAQAWTLTIECEGSSGTCVTIVYDWGHTSVNGSVSSIEYDA